METEVKQEIENLWQSQDSQDAQINNQLELIDLKLTELGNHIQDFNVRFDARFNEHAQDVNRVWHEIQGQVLKAVVDIKNDITNIRQQVLDQVLDYFRDEVVKHLTQELRNHVLVVRSPNRGETAQFVFRPATREEIKQSGENHG